MRGLNTELLGVPPYKPVIRLEGVVLFPLSSTSDDIEKPNDLHTFSFARLLIDKHDFRKTTVLRMQKGQIFSQGGIESASYFH